MESKCTCYHQNLIKYELFSVVFDGVYGQNIKYNQRQFFCDDDDDENVQGVNNGCLLDTVVQVVKKAINLKRINNHVRPFVQPLFSGSCSFIHCQVPT